MTAIRGLCLGADWAGEGMAITPTRRAMPAIQAGMIRYFMEDSLRRIDSQEGSCDGIVKSRQFAFHAAGQKHHRNSPRCAPAGGLCSLGRPVLTFDSVPWCVRSMGAPVLLVQTLRE